MARSRNQSWSPEDLPSLSLGNDAVRLDIGHLGAEDHRRAFATIFAKMVRDNRPVLDPLELVSIESRRPFVPKETSFTLPVAMADVAESANELALDLYDSHNETMVLVLRGPTGRRELGVRFDNPEFWLI